MAHKEFSDVIHILHMQDGGLRRTSLSSVLTLRQGFSRVGTDLLLRNILAFPSAKISIVGFSTYVL